MLEHVICNINIAAMDKKRSVPTLERLEVSFMIQIRFDTSANLHYIPRVSASIVLIIRVISAQIKSCGRCKYQVRPCCGSTAVIHRVL